MATAECSKTAAVEPIAEPATYLETDNNQGQISKLPREAATVPYEFMVTL
jgi:hypothetical protein